MNFLENIKALVGRAKKKHHLARCPDPAKSYPSVSPYRKEGTERRKHVITQSIYRYYIPLNIMKATDSYMSSHRKHETECFLFWGGYLLGRSEAQIVTLYYPKVITNYGRVYLSNKDITLLNQSLREHDQLLLIELHTHPYGTGGQNTVDASNALSYHNGFITIVVPDFGYPHFYDLRKCYIYEYQNKGLWQELEPDQIEDRFIIEDSIIEIGEHPIGYK